MRLALFVCLTAAACGGGGAGDDQMNSDASFPSSDAPGAQNLLVAWIANPALPGTIDTDLTISSAKFKLERLQVVGDNGQPMTTAPQALQWVTEGQPATVSFASAPSGLYSQINLKLDGEIINYSYEIVGTAKINGSTESFKIQDRNSLDVDVKGFTSALSPGGQVTMTVRLDLKDAIKNINFDSLSEDDGYRVLDTTSTQMPAFRQKLQDSFKKGP